MVHMCFVYLDCDLFVSRDCWSRRASTRFKFFLDEQTTRLGINSICSESREKYRVPKIYGRLLGDPPGPVINRTSRFLRKRQACVFPIRSRFHRTYRCVF